MAKEKVEYEELLSALALAWTERAASIGYKPKSTRWAKAMVEFWCGSQAALTALGRPLNNNLLLFFIAMGRDPAEFILHDYEFTAVDNMGTKKDMSLKVRATTLERAQEKAHHAAQSKWAGTPVGPSYTLKFLKGPKVEPRKH